MALSYPDKRIFPRYRLNLDCEVLIAGEKVKARLADFSIGGLGLLVEDTPDFNPEEFDIKIKEIDLDTKARIVWTKDVFSRKKLSIQNLGPIKGSLPLCKITDFIIGLHRKGKTGILQVNADQHEKKVYFKDGEVIFSASNQEKERMGDMLLENGKITRDQYDKAVELMKKTGIRHGAALSQFIQSSSW
jgi:hypothetical protein